MLYKTQTKKKAVAKTKGKNVSRKAKTCRCLQCPQLDTLCSKVMLSPFNMILPEGHRRLERDNPRWRWSEDEMMDVQINSVGSLLDKEMRAHQVCTNDREFSITVNVSLTSCYWSPSQPRCVISALRSGQLMEHHNQGQWLFTFQMCNMRNAKKGWLCYERYELCIVYRPH